MQTVNNTAVFLYCVQSDSDDLSIAIGLKSGLFNVDDYTWISSEQFSGRPLKMTINLVFRFGSMADHTRRNAHH